MTNKEVLVACFRAMADKLETIPETGGRTTFVIDDFMDEWCEGNPFYKRVNLPDYISLDDSALLCMFCTGHDGDHYPDCEAGYLEKAAQGRVTGNMTIGSRK